MIIPPNQCASCQWNQWDGVDPLPKCEAFPGGIPIDIWQGYAMHIDPWPTDNGIQYQPKEGVEGVMRSYFSYWHTME